MPGHPTMSRTQRSDGVVEYVKDCGSQRPSSQDQGASAIAAHHAQDRSRPTGGDALRRQITTAALNSGHASSMLQKT